MQPPNRQGDGLDARGGLDQSLSATYVKVIVLEVVIIVLLWVFGRLYS